VTKPSCVLWRSVGAQALSDEARREASRAGGRADRAVAEIGRDGSLFWPMRGEIDRSASSRHVQRWAGKSPCRSRKSATCSFALSTASIAGRRQFGTRHPHAGQPVLDPDLIIAPLAAFDRQGGRIGYGAAFTTAPPRS
jgi:5-formyltetrahydrofolate cyclo-ligase